MSVTGEREVIPGNTGAEAIAAKAGRNRKLGELLKIPPGTVLAAALTDFSLSQFFSLQLSLTSLEGKVGEDRRYHLYPDTCRQDGESAWGFPSRS